MKILIFLIKIFKQYQNLSKLRGCNDLKTKKPITNFFSFFRPTVLHDKLDPLVDHAAARLVKIFIGFVL